MQNRSSAWAALAATGYFILETKAVIGNTTYNEISAPIIKRGLFTDSLSVGNCSAASLQISIRTDDAIGRAAKVEIYQRLLSEAGGTPTEWLPAGSFYIASRSRDYASGLVTLQCYDAMLKTREDYFADGVIVGTWPKSMTDVVAEIAQKIGVQVDSRTTISAGQIPAPVSYTLMDVLGFIGGVCGGNWIITEEEKLRLVPLVDAPTSESADAYAITAVLGSLQLGKTMTISRVTMTSGEGEEAVTYTAGDDTGYELVVGNNPYATQDICDDLLDALGGLVYAPFSASNAICDPAMELGDKITYGNTLYSIIVQEDRTLGAAYRDNISAPANEEIEDEYPYVSGMAKETQRLQRGVDNAKKVATSYLSADATGIMVANMTDGTVQTPSEATGRNVFIDPDSVDVRNGTTVLASFGEQTKIGQEDREGYSQVIDSEKWTVVEHKFSGSGTLESRNIVEVGAALGSSEESEFWMDENSFHGTASSASEAHLYLDFNEDVVPDADGLFEFWGRYHDGSIYVFNDRRFQTAELRYFIDNTAHISSADKAELLEQEATYPYISKVYFSAGITFYHFSCAAGVLFEVTSGKKFILCPEPSETYFTYSGSYSGGEDKAVEDIPTAYTLIEPTGGSETYSLDLGTWTDTQLRKLRMKIVSDGQGGYEIAHFYDYVVPFLIFDQRVPRPKYMLGTRQADALGDFSFGAGENVNPIGHNSATIGQNLIASYDGQTIVGKNNESTNRYVFAVGNGTDEDARSNAFEVTDDGNILLDFDPTAAAGTTDGDLYAAIAAVGWTDIIEV